MEPYDEGKLDRLGLLRSENYVFLSFRWRTGGHYIYAAIRGNHYPSPIQNSRQFVFDVDRLHRDWDACRSLGWISLWDTLGYLTANCHGALLICGDLRDGPELFTRRRRPHLEPKVSI